MLEVKNLYKNYGDHRVLENINFKLGEGESLVLVGESGSGKTTLAKIITGLEKDYKGDIVFQGQILEKDYRKRDFHDLAGIQYIFQDPYSALESSFTLGQTLGELVRISKRHGYQPMDMDEALGLVDKSLINCKHREIATFSGGQRQKICLARALMTRPKLIIADEATSMLDQANTMEINNLLNSLKDQLGLSIIAIIHDVDFHYRGWNKIGVISKKGLKDFLDFGDFFQEASSTYGRELIESHKYFYG